MNREQLKKHLQISIDNAIEVVTHRHGKLYDNTDPFFYISGGTARRLYMLQHNIPMTQLDMDDAVAADIDVFIDMSNNPTGHGDINGLEELTVTVNGFKPFEKINKTVQCIFMNRFQFLEPFFDMECCQFVIDPRDPTTVICKYAYGDDFFKSGINPTDISYSTVCRMIKYARYGFIFNEQDVFDFCKKLNMDVYTLKNLYSEHDDV